MAAQDWRRSLQYDQYNDPQSYALNLLAQAASKVVFVAICETDNRIM